MAALTRAGAGKTTEAENSYVIRPSYKKKFPVGRVKEIMLAVMREKLADSKYDTELSAVISHDIREKLKGACRPGRQHNALECWWCRRRRSCAGTVDFRVDLQSVCVVVDVLCDIDVVVWLVAVVSLWVRGCVEGVAALDLPRYKFMVQVVMGEQKGEGVRCVCSGCSRQTRMSCVVLAEC